MNFGKIEVLRAPEGATGGGDGGAGGDGKGGDGKGGAGGDGKGGGDGKTNNVGAGDPGWYGQFNDESRAVLREAGFKESPNEVVKTLATLRAEAGKDRIVVPGEGATAEQLQSFRKAIGAGDKPEAYAWEDVNVGDSNKGFVGAFQAALHKHGVPVGAAKGLVSDLLGWTKTTREKEIGDAANEIKQETNQLNATWGAEAAANTALAYRAAEAMGLSKEDVHKLGGAAGYSKIMQGLAKVGGYMREGRRLPGGENIPNVDGDSYEGAKAWLDKAKTDPGMRQKLRAGDKALLAEHARMVKVMAQGPG